MRMIIEWLSDLEENEDVVLNQDGDENVCPINIKRLGS